MVDTVALRDTPYGGFQVNVAQAHPIWGWPGSNTVVNLKASVECGENPLVIYEGLHLGVSSDSPDLGLGATGLGGSPSRSGPMV